VQPSDNTPCVIGFYSDREGKLCREFSTFFSHTRPCEYVLPEFAQRDGSPESCWLDFSEDALMRDLEPEYSATGGVAAACAVLGVNAWSSKKSENSTDTVRLVPQAAAALDGAAQHAAAAVQLPVMSSNGAPLLIYRDANASGASRLSVAAACPQPLRLIFLDVDGVLNNHSYTPPDDATPSCDVLLPECLAELKVVLDTTGAHVVLSSTWRSEVEQRAKIVGTLEQMRPGCVVGQTPRDPSYRNHMRPVEIASFLDEPAVIEVTDSKDVIWCAVDDMDLIDQAEGLKKKHPSVWRLLPALKQTFVKTDKYTGLDSEIAKQIQHILNDPRASTTAQDDERTNDNTRGRKERAK